MLKVVHEESETNESRTLAGSSLLDEIVRDGARQMLAAALQAEVAAYIEAHGDQLDEAGHRLVVRNGHHAPREVTTAAGAVVGVDRRSGQRGEDLLLQPRGGVEGAGVGNDRGRCARLDGAR